MLDAAVLIGRFQPVHHGHLALVREALARAPQVFIVVGSAYQARSPKNPFTWQERATMLRESLPETERHRVTVLPIRDHYNERLWAQAVQQAVIARTGPQARIALVGHFKDASSSYLAAFPEWSLVRMQRQASMDANTIRDAYFGALPGMLDVALAPLADDVPGATRRWLATFSHTPQYTYLQEEWRMLRDYRASWAGAPYPPIFVTVDAVVLCQQQVLLIQRARAPGKGLWALPGGFLEPHDTLWQSCLRELAEETHCELPESTWRAALQQVRVFDHPDRSQRGRTITHVHRFDLGNASVPPVRADDDAALATWVPIYEIAALEDQFFEDHFHVVSQMLPGVHARSDNA